MGNKSSVAENTILVKNTTKNVIENPDVKVVENTSRLKQATELINNFSNKLYQYKSLINNSSSLSAYRTIEDEITLFHLDLENRSQVLSENEYKLLKTIYRKKINKYWQEGAISKRIIDKPRGYHGDYKIIDYMYENKPVGTTELGKLMHKYILNNPSCVSVRKRKDYLVNQLVTICHNNKEANILSLASGPSYEVFEALQTEKIHAKNIVLFDQDEEALGYAFNRINKINTTNTNIILVKASILDLIKSKGTLLDKYAPFNYIYSAGLYDYLSEILARNLTKTLISILKKDGILDIGNFETFPIGFFAEIASDWKLILRNKQDFEKIIPKEFPIKFKKIGDQLFINTIKP